MALTRVHNRLIAGAPVNVKDFGAVGDGVTDDTAAVQAALTHIRTLSGSSLYFPTGTYVITDSELSLNVPCRVFGDGHTSVIQSSLNTVAQCVSIKASNVIIENIKIDARDVNDFGVALLIAASASLGFIEDIVLNNVAITGANSLNANDDARCHGIKVSNGTNLRRLRVDGCLVERVRLGLFTENVFGAAGNTAEDVIVTGSTFVDLSVRALVFNTDFATSAVQNAWLNVLVDSCIFKGMTGNIDLSNNRCTMVGTDGCKGLTVSNCHFIDLTRPTDCAIHVENYSPYFTCTGNTFQNCFGGIAFYGLSSSAVITGNNIQSSNNRTEADDPATFNVTLASTGDKGIHLVNDADGSADDVLVSNNVIVGFQTGIQVTGSAERCIVSNNYIKLVAFGFVCQANSEAYNIEGNRVGLSRYFARLNSTASATFGKNTMEDCIALFEAVTTNRKTIMSGLRIIQTVNYASGVAVKYPLFDVPVMANAKYHGRAFEAATPDDEAVFYCDFLVSSAGALALSNEDRINSGTLTVAANNFLEIVSGSLTQKLFNSVQPQDLTYEVEFDGTLIWLNYT